VGVKRRKFMVGRKSREKKKREREREKGEFCSGREVGRDTRIVVFSVGHVSTQAE
jgi:hypothetical protein